ncbi:hypothetical protein [Mesorhizobium sp.]|uniref:hypothetical protein n=1 Tax=Mesorhizobium sp. TaxID=1871066 RepID=UPI000FE9311A|nr:hypothetical protein [Mesorhizobium sp.]RWM17958.1 MAG: hypothetical protein EOR74_33055 [Mesorhizobium sp.]RWM30344.1 MAG: hypothetical protein EOR75_31490 [Mesorhizobium sp.]TIO72874.1 MAG: hypothetical protein E5X75_30770 [Mesorhizobium sp.]TIO80787.1 MAG: hypothetical protein E5X74_31575 [Mesorhizobium sp.]TJV47878.1 MAG: hypothetical protein E5Y01_30825 [Mesorhizobium sp.]
MHPFLALDMLAAPRGDGLHPKLARLLRSRIALAAPGVIALRQAKCGQDQAGPNPVGNVDGSQQKGVLRFPARQSFKVRRRKS